MFIHNVPVQPSKNILSSGNGKFQYMFLPKNTTAPIQIVDQEIILETKPRYRKKIDTT